MTNEAEVVDFNYSSESKGPIVNTVCTIFMVLTAIVIGLRMFSRLWVVRAMGMDDILICFAALCSWGFSICVILCVNKGLGKHFTSVPVENLPSYTRRVWASSMFYNACLGFIKTSALALYLRLTPSLTFRRVALFMMFIVSAQATSNVSACIFQCTPIKFLWDRTLPGGHCININAFYLANAALNIFTDFLTYTLPMPMLWKLQLPKRQKIGLVTILGLGGFACISSIIRITYVAPMLTSADPSWVIAEPMYWSVIEINIGILAASIPSFKILVKEYFPRMLGSGYSGHDQSGGVSGGLSAGAGANSRYKKGYSERSYSMDRMKNGAMNTTVTGGHTQLGSRNGSQEHIMIPDGMIVRTTAVVVDESHSTHSLGDKDLESQVSKSSSSS